MRVIFVQTKSEIPDTPKPWHLAVVLAATIFIVQQLNFENMEKAWFVLLLLATVTCFSQTERKLSTFASLQYNHTLYDQEPFHKTGIAGLGLQLFSNPKNLFGPTLEINADLFNEHGIGAADEPTK